MWLKCRGRAGQWVRRIAQEPFFHFWALGFLIWMGVTYWSADPDRYVIHLGSLERQRIAQTYALQFGEPPTPQQMTDLVERYVRDEIYWREGLALELDQKDEIVRRRIVQKYEFLQTDLRVADPPDEEVLRRWFARHAQRYRTPEQVAFKHVFFSLDADGEAAAKIRASRALGTLRSSQSFPGGPLGDPFPGSMHVGAVPADEADRLFGVSPLTKELFSVPVGQWAGPYRSGYGWHLVYVTGRTPTTYLRFEDIRLRVLADFEDETRRLLNARAFDELKARYIIEDHGERP